GPEPSGFEGLRAISVHASRRQVTVAEGHDVRVWQLDRHSARAALGHDAHEHHYLVARLDNALQFKTPFGPGVPQHCEHVRESLPAPEDRFALRVAAGKPKLVLLVEVVAKHAIDERGVVVRVSTPQTGEQRIPATDKLDVRRHRSAKYPAVWARRSSAPCGPASPGRSEGPAALAGLRHASTGR